VVLDVPRATLVATIARSSLERLALEPGQPASALVKATELTITP
jgi:molybdopterin-binding protein